MGLGHLRLTALTSFEIISRNPARKLENLVSNIVEWKKWKEGGVDWLGSRNHRLKAFSLPNIYLFKTVQPLNFGI